MSDIAYRVRTELARYLAREISLADFVEAFLPLAWTMGLEEEDVAGDLVHEIELRLAEHSNGHLPEHELRERLSRLVQEYSLVMGSGRRSRMIVTSTSTPAASAPVWSPSLAKSLRVTLQPMGTS